MRQVPRGAGAGRHRAGHGRPPTRGPDPDLDVRAHPDVRIDSPAAFVLVEAKRLRRSSFQADQLAKELILAAEHARDRHPVLLLAWTTWAEIGAQVQAALQTYDNPDESTYNAVARVARSVADALQVHA